MKVELGCDRDDKTREFKMEPQEYCTRVMEHSGCKEPHIFSQSFELHRSIQRIVTKTGVCKN